MKANGPCTHTVKLYFHTNVLETCGESTGKAIELSNTLEVQTSVCSTLPWRMKS